MMAKIGELAPEISVSTWVQGQPISLQQLRGKVVLIEVFQVNCPGCFIHGLPEVVRLHEILPDKELVIIGLATAFEDFDKNTLKNLERFVNNGELIGVPLQQLGAAGLLNENKLDLKLPFAVGMDTIEPVSSAICDQEIITFLIKHISEYDQLSDQQKQSVYSKAKQYLESCTHIAKTFETYNLKGTPSSIVIDKKGILRSVSFGTAEHLKPLLLSLLAMPI